MTEPTPDVARKHDKRGQLDRSICGACGDAFWECSGCGVYFCDCSRSIEACAPEPRSRPAESEAEACRCQVIGWVRDPYEPHIPSQPEWEQADDCPVHPLSRPAATGADQ